MTVSELAYELKRMYDNADGNKVTMIHLFGIKYANEIRNNNYSSKEIVQISGLQKSYQTEVLKGIKLADYVEIKSDISL